MTKSNFSIQKMFRTQAANLRSVLRQFTQRTRALFIRGNSPVLDKTLILHIGMHKTGTTSIQRCYRNFDDGRRRYLDLGPMPNHSIPIFSLYTESINDYDALQNQLLTTEQTGKALARWKNHLRHEFDTHDRSVYIMSGEDIGLLSDAGKAALIADMQQEVDNIRVIMYVRRPLSFVVSAVQERIKNGNCAAITTPIAVGYARRASAFQALLGRSSVEIYEYEKVSQSSNGVLDHFSQLLELHPPNTHAATNQRLNEPVVKLLFLLNRLNLTLTSPARREVTRILGGLYMGASELDVKAFEETFVVTEKDVALMVEHHIQMEQQKADRNAVHELDRYLADISTVDLDPLSNHLDSIGISPGEHNASALLSALCAQVISAADRI